MIVKCDRCGEAYDFEYDFIYGNGIQKISVDEEGKRIRVPYIEESIALCPSCMAKLNDWLTPDKQKPDTGNKNEWNSMNVQPQCGEAVEIKFENGDLDIAYRKYADKRWFQSSGEWVASDSKIVAWRYLY